MNRLLILTLIIFGALPVFGQYNDPTYGTPQIVLFERNPWLMVIGSDTPTFVLYEKGQIIYKKTSENKQTIFEVQLDPEQKRSFIADIGLSKDFYALPKEIVATGWTDQPSNQLVINLDNPKNIYVYGNLRRAGSLEKPPPEAFLNVYKKLIDYTNTNAKEWAPRRMEVMFWDFSYAKNKTPWPKDLPDLNSPTTIKFPGDMYSVFLEPPFFERFKSFFASIGEKTAVEINGKKMAISYRYPFPNI
jgi:hypothetical protein